jgi:hypothetical protein
VVIGARPSTASRVPDDVLAFMRRLPQIGEPSESAIEERACPVCGARSGQPCSAGKAAANGIQIGAIAHAGRFVVAP